ncbi:cellulose biosynthesis protein BcsO [Kalamiella sp. sgz302252]|uniref:cellulose biosynthesis protein BcsO n=1 Tax=Pantoea sp. sgz302252 TaxID=3341827 RepID=UPI0036D348BF
MKSYDDLQRFKEKTQTNHIEFRDLSEQTRNADSTDWAIIRQLMDKGADAALGNGQRTDIAAPQPAAADLFSKAVAEAAPVKAAAKISAPVSASVTAFVAAKPAAQGGSLLDAISASLKPAATAPAPVAAEPEAVNRVPHTPLKVAESPLLASLAMTQPEAARSVPEQTFSVADVPQAHSPAAFHTPEPGAGQEVRFKQLFSASGARAAEEKALPKETLLQPLLEKIALCR